MNELVVNLPDDIMEKYEILNYNYALEILATSFSNEYNDLIDVLRNVHITIDDILQSGGNESPIPPKFKEILFPRGWAETNIHGDLELVMDYRNSKLPSERTNLKDHVNGYNIDFFKNKIAMDTEWNSKDQTFDRDLLAMRTYFDCGLIDVGVIVTRAEGLNDIFKMEKDNNGQPLIKKYGASTTWMGKLTYRLDSRRNGGCPVLAIGIGKECIEEYGRLSEYYTKLTGIHERKEI